MNNSAHNRENRKSGSYSAGLLLLLASVGAAAVAVCFALPHGAVYIFAALDDSGKSLERASDMFSRAMLTRIAPFGVLSIILGWLATTQFWRAFTCKRPPGR